MALLLKAKAAFKGRDRTSLFLKLRDVKGARPAIWAAFKRGEKMEELARGDLQPRLEMLTDMEWGQFHLLAGLRDCEDDMRLAAHHAICMANELTSLQKPEKKVSFFFLLALHALYLSFAL